MSNVFNRSLQQHRMDDRDLQRFVRRTIVNKGSVMGEARDKRDVMLAIIQNEVQVPPLVDGHCTEAVPVEIDAQQAFQLAVVVPPRMIDTRDGFSLNGVAASGFNEVTDIHRIETPVADFEGAQMLSRPPNNQMTLVDKQTTRVFRLPSEKRPLMLSPENEEEVFTILLWRVRDELMEVIQNDGFSLQHEMALHDPNVKEPLAAFKVRLIAKKDQAEAAMSM